MTHPIPDDELLRSYLRGELPESEADDLERRLLVEDDLFDVLEALEAELLAAASRDALPPEDNEWVLRRLASSPRGRERLALARSLATLADGVPEAPPSLAPVLPMRQRFSKPRFVWSGLAAAAGLLLAVGLWLASEQSHPRGPAVTDRRPATGRPGPRREETAPPVVQPPAKHESPTAIAREKEGHGPAQRPQPVKAVFALSLATLRGAEGKEILRVAPGVEIVEMQLDLEGLEDLKSFDILVKDSSKTTVWEKTGLAPRRLEWGTALVFDIPAERLPAGHYQVTVATGAEELTKEFEVAREER